MSKKEVLVYQVENTGQKVYVSEIEEMTEFDWYLVSDETDKLANDLAIELGLDQLEVYRESYNRFYPKEGLLSGNITEVLNKLLYSPEKNKNGVNIYKKTDPEFYKQLKVIESKLEYLDNLTEGMTSAEVHVDNRKVGVYFNDDYYLSAYIDTNELLKRVDMLIENEFNQAITNKAKTVKLRMKFVEEELYDELGIESEIDEILDELVVSITEPESYKALENYLNKSISEFCEEREKLYDELEEKELVY